MQPKQRRTLCGVQDILYSFFYAPIKKIGAGEGSGMDLAVSIVGTLVLIIFTVFALRGMLSLSKPPCYVEKAKHDKGQKKPEDEKCIELEQEAVSRETGYPTNEKTKE